MPMGDVIAEEYVAAGLVHLNRSPVGLNSVELFCPPRMTVRVSPVMMEVMETEILECQYRSATE